MSIQVIKNENRLVQIQRDIESSDWVVTPDQEAEIEALVTANVEDAVQAIVLSEMTVESLKALLKEAKIILDAKEAHADSIRAKVKHVMLKNGVEKVKADDGLFTATLMQSRGGLKILVPIEDLPAQYRKEVTEFKQDTDMIRLALESGIEPKTEDGRLIANVNEEPYLTIYVNKKKALEYRIKGLLT